MLTHDFGIMYHSSIMIAINLIDMSIIFGFIVLYFDCRDLVTDPLHHVVGSKDHHRQFLPDNAKNSYRT